MTLNIIYKILITKFKNIFLKKYKYINLND